MMHFPDMSLPDERPSTMTELAPLLTSEERADLEQCETQIAQGAAQIGNALNRIRDRRLYREDHATFEDYCRVQWGIGRNYANKQIATANVAAILGTNVPIREAHARELTTLRDDPDRMRKVWDEAVEQTGGKVTAKAIREARDAAEDTRVTLEEAEARVEASRHHLIEAQTALVDVAVMLFAGGCSKADIVLMLGKVRRAWERRGDDEEIADMLAGYVVDPIIKEVIAWELNGPVLHPIPHDEMQRIIDHVTSGVGRVATWQDAD